MISQDAERVISKAGFTNLNVVRALSGFVVLVLRGRLSDGDAACVADGHRMSEEPTAPAMVIVTERERAPGRWASPRSAHEMFSWMAIAA